MASKKKVTIQPNPSIIIDIREEYVLKEFERRYSDPTAPNKKKIRWEKQMLPVGDIWFKYGDTPIILIERKTLSDLDSSITQDGRYKEQKLRILDSKIPQKYYIVEGNLYGPLKNHYFKEKDKNRLYGAIVNTTVRDRLPVLRTENLEDTIKTLEKMYDALEKHGLVVLANSQIKINTDASVTPYVETLKPSKKGNMTPEVCYLAQLMQIPGVSSTIAQRIKEEYGNFKALFSAYDVALEEKKKQKLLADLMLPNKRRIGPAVSGRVYEFLFAN